MSRATSWLELSFTASPAEADGLGECLEALGALAVTLSDAEPAADATPPWHETRVSGLFAPAVAPEVVAAAVQRRLGRPAAPPCAVREVRDRDWEASVRAGFQARCFGDRLWVRPRWCAPAGPADSELVLDPGMAFGTGAHETTALCLDWLARQDVTGRRVIDYGCGSGILALAALRLGASAAWAIDDDRRALAITRENAAINGLTARLAVTTPEGLGDAVQADLLLANIALDTLVELAPAMAARLVPGGRLALSGITAAQAGACLETYAPAFELAAPVLENGWALLAGRRRSSGDVPGC